MTFDDEHTANDTAPVRTASGAAPRPPTSRSRRATPPVDDRGTTPPPLAGGRSVLHVVGPADRARSSGAGRRPGGDRPRQAPRPQVVAPTRPAVAAVARRFALGWLDVEAGRRPVRHLFGLVTEELERALSVQLGRLPLHDGPTASLVRLLVDHGGDRCEAVATIDRDGRRAALAIELARTPEGWRVATLEVPPVRGARGRLGRQPLRLPPRW